MRRPSKCRTEEHLDRTKQSEKNRYPPEKKFDPPRGSMETMFNSSSKPGEL